MGYFAKGILSLLGSWCKVPLSKWKMAFHDLIKSDRSISNQVNCDPIHIDTFRNGPFHNMLDVIVFLWSFVAKVECTQRLFLYMLFEIVKSVLFAQLKLASGP
jgi:hypothetical protein